MSLYNVIASTDENTVVAEYTLERAQSAEITARQKQYEHYRDKLLTFMEKIG